jgi:PAS domain S-box-containing protein
MDTNPAHADNPGYKPSMPHGAAGAASSARSANDELINILIVDDEPKNLTVLETILYDPAYRLVRAESADQALLALVVEDFALLILDIRMPGMTGFELAHMIKERKKTARVPIIFLTAYYNEDQHVLEGYDTGAVDYLQKPVNPSVLRSKVAVFAELYRKSRELTLANRSLLAEVSERRRFEEELRELNATLERRVIERSESLTTSESRFRTLFNSIDEGFCVIEMLFDAAGHPIDYRYLEANPAFETQMGLQGAAGKSARELAPQTEAYWFETLGGVALSGEAVRFVHEAKTLNRWFEVYAFRLGSAESRKVAILFSDITISRQAEDALRRREQEIRSIADNIPHIIARYDRDLRHLFVNAAVRQVTGLPITACVGKTSRELWMPTAVCDTWEASLRDVFATGRATVVPFSINTATGQRHYEGRLIPERGANGQVEHVLAVIQDVTEAKQIAETLARAKETADAASLAKDQFLAVLSHELRTPLTPVRMAVSIWERKKEFLPAEFKSDLAMIRRNVDLECRLIDDMLDLSRIARGKLEIQFSPVDLNEEARHAVAIVEAEAAAKQIVLSFDPDAARAKVLGDGARLQQILWNLLRNAVKFTPPRGAVSVRTFNDPGGRISVEVRDTGTGIDPSVIERIFNAFEQGGAHVTRQFGGLGLGLAISKALCDMHGGKLTAHSDGKGRGSTFTLTLDLAAPIESAAQDRAAPPPASALLSSDGNANPRCILLVEDHQDTARIMRHLLESFGYAVHTAASVAEALRVADSKVFDLIVSDIGLPDGTGYELMRQLIARRPTKGIALTGYGMEEDLRQGAQAGFAAYLTKPINVEQLELTIQRVLGIVPRRALEMQKTNRRGAIS